MATMAEAMAGAYRAAGLAMPDSRPTAGRFDVYYVRSCGRDSGRVMTARMRTTPADARALQAVAPGGYIVVVLPAGSPPPVAPGDGE